MQGIEQRGALGATRWLAVFGLLLGGCYSGLGNGSGDPTADDGGDGADGDDDDDDDGPGPDDGDDDDDDTPSDGDCSAPDAGPTRLQRLTAVEYENTVRDLLAIEVDARAELPEDDRIGPFEGNEATAVPPYTVEIYADLAEDIAELAVAEPPPGLIPCDPQVDGADACARTFIESLLPRAFRRPVSEVEIERYVDLYEIGTQEGAFADGIRLVITAVLQSSSFLYRLELGDAEVEPAAGDLIPLTAYELATRLSYFAWRTMPDEALVQAAASGELETAAGIETQIRRLLDDPRAGETIASFHVQLLGVDMLETTEKSPTLFPAFTTQARDDMRTELELFVQDVMSNGDRTLASLLTASHSFVSPALAEIYGVDIGDAAADEFVRVDLPPEQRAGILTLPGVLAVHSHLDQTSPVQRGLAIRTRMLCGTLPPPPPGVGDTPPELDPTLPVRERYPMSTVDDCSYCHEQTDPLGFGLEHYDAIGAWRTQDGDFAVDDSGEIVGTDVAGPFNGGVELAQRLADSEVVRHCMSNHWLRFSLSRPVAHDRDACAVDEVQAVAVDTDYDIAEVLVAIATSQTFRHRRIAEELEGQ